VVQHQGQKGARSQQELDPARMTDFYKHVSDKNQDPLWYQNKKK
jgi:hypothetical protein